MADAYLLDTNLVSALWDRLHPQHDSARSHVEAFGSDPVYVSVVTFAEIEYGLLTAPRISGTRQSMVRDAMRAFRLVLDIGGHTYGCYADLRARLFGKYSPKDGRGRLKAKRVADLWERTPDKLLGIQENDLWLAGQAMERDLVLVTSDRMTRIIEVAASDLRVQKWC